MKKLLISLAVITALSGCAIIQSTGITELDPTVTTQRDGVKKEFDTVPAPAAGKPISVAVYSFADKTGQRRPQANVASLSSAVTQGAETFLIQALQGVGLGQWFEVVERVGIDNLTKERLIIRQMREAYEGNNAKPLMPMQFAGIIMEGGIVGYDTTVNSGGAGMRIFGIGKQTQWSQDTVTVSLRAISVNTGKVLAVVTVQKTILSTADSATALKFFDAGTQAFEAEAGMTINEPGTYAVKSAIEMAVVELIKEGQRKAIWDFKSNIPLAPLAPVEKPAPQPVISSEIRKPEEKKDELVQPQTTEAPKGAPESAPPTPPEPSIRKDDGGDQKKSEGNRKEEVVAALPATQVVTVQPEVKKVGKFGAYIYKEPKDGATRMWFFMPGTEVEAFMLNDIWYSVKEKTGKKGFVKQDRLE
jgi:curli production assembly/transport component CsgG